MHDGISFEQLGKPALVLCTKPFEATGHMIATTTGLPDFRFALLDHPIGSASAAGIAARAEDAYRQGLSILRADQQPTRFVEKAKPSP